MRIGILGGGLTGVALKHFLPDATLLEKEAALGGLCRSFSKDGFSYDQGGHILFSKDQKRLSSIISLFGDNIAKFYRRNCVWFKGRFVKYPFENGLPDLPFTDRLSCFYHYVTRPKSLQKNFRDWVTQKFGRGFADRYLVPYNEKIWKTPLDEMATNWVERIPDPPFSDLIRGVLGMRTEGYLHQLNFYYPKTGGIEALIKAYSCKAEGLRCNFEVKHVAKSDGQWVVTNGDQELRYDKIISTVPVTELLNMLDGVPHNIKDAARKLRCNSLIVVLVGVKSNIPPRHFAVYFPQLRLIFHRVCFPAYLGYAPAGMSSMVAEITLPPDEPKISDEEIVRNVVDGLSNEGFLKRADVVVTDVRRTRFAYVVDTHDRKGCMDLIRRFLSDRGIIICGRFAEFEYLNMDACIARALDLAQKIKNGEV